MNITQSIVYSLKPFTSTGIGGLVRNSAKTAAGSVFDLLYREYRSDGCAFSIPQAQTTRRMRAKFLLDTYELPERTLIKQHVPPQGVVLELGASLGIVSCVINRCLADKKRHIAVEINPDLIPAIERNRAQNGCEFTVLQCAVTRRDKLSFSADKNSDSGRVSEAGGVAVPVRDLLDIEAAHGLSFDTIVMDIEGAEIEFIAEYELILPRINTMVIEFHPGFVGEDKTEEARQRLMRAGLKPAGKMLEVEAFVR